jgi:hypothetical protein
VQSIALHQHRAVRVHVANGPKDTQEVETNDRATVIEPVNDTLEELRFGKANDDRGGDTADFEKGVEEVFKGVSFRGYEALEQRLKRLQSDQFIFDLGCFIL